MFIMMRAPEIRIDNRLSKTDSVSGYSLDIIGNVINKCYCDKPFIEAVSWTRTAQAYLYLKSNQNKAKRLQLY